MISVAADVAGSAGSLAIDLSYCAPIRLAGDMRSPDRTELEFTMLLFAALVPTAYYTVRYVMELL